MTRQRLRALAAGMALLGIAVGVPVLLYGLGGGLPTGLPSSHQAATFLGRPLTDSAILRAVSLVCWAVWLLFVAAVAAETIAWVRERPGPSVTGRGFRIPGLQGAAGSLFLTAVLLLPHRPASTGSLTAGRIQAPPAITAVNDDPRVAALRSLDMIDVSRPPDTRVPYVVQHGETLWGIAEAHVGNGLAWRQITDVTGRSFDTGVDDWVQVNGRMIDERQARLIYRGETVYLPASWARIDPTPVAAADTVQDPPVVSANPAAGKPHEAPAQPQPAISTPSTTSDPVPTSNGQAPHVQQTGHPHSGDATEVLELVGAGMIAGAVLSTLNRQRSRQSRQRRPGRRIRLPVEHLAVTEIDLRAGERPDLIGATHRALHRLASDLSREQSAIPTICGVVAGDDRVEVLLGRPATPPDPWQNSADGYRWSLPTEQIPSGISFGCEPVPALIPVGRVPGTSDEALINLAAAGILHIRGTPERAEGLIHAAGLAFTGLPWAESADVIAVGLGPVLGDSAVHVRSVSTLDEVIDELEKQAAELRASLGAPVESGIDRPDGWLPTIVLLRCPAHTESLDRLLALCSGQSGVFAMVSPPASGPGWVIDVESVPALVPHLRLAIEPIFAPAGWAGAVNELLEVAADMTDVGIDEPPYDQLQSGERPEIKPPSTPSLSSNALDDPGQQATECGTARINVLGPVTFEDVEDFLRPRSFEIAVYLALHPDGVSEGRLDEMVWPSKTEVASSTRDQAISAARTALGGRSRFPLAHGQGRGKVYRLSDEVTTDWTEFCALYRLGRENKSVDTLRSALQLVRGRPFGDLDAGPGFQWLHVEGHTYHMQAEIADAADVTAGLYLDQGRPLEARWAAYQGLLAGPYTERLWVRLMAVADALGEAQEIQRLLGEMDARIGLEGDYGQLHPDTIAAYRRYSRHRVSPRS
jgi:DNA-binding SARP family transcriptional activator